jgi:hypothetical protein
LQCWDDLAEARAIGPNAMAEHDSRLGCCRHFIFSPLVELNCLLELPLG